MNFTELKNTPVSELTTLGENIRLKNLARMCKQDITLVTLKQHVKSGEDIFGDGILEILQDGFGLLHSTDSSYLAGPGDIYVSPSRIRRFSLRTGDTTPGKIRPSREGERYLVLLKVNEVNLDKPENARNKILFEDLTPLHTSSRPRMGRDNDSTEDLTARVLDLVPPIGRGQRGPIVAPPRAGKTMLLQNIVQNVAHNRPDCVLMVLLTDERPEEVAEMQRLVKGEAVASTFDEPASHRVQTTGMVIEKAKRPVGCKRDVIILLDSIICLACAYSTAVLMSGKALTGGVDADALYRLKRLLGATCNVERGGSSTTTVTTLIDTGHKTSGVIYEEFKGIGSMEPCLPCKTAKKRVFPATDHNRSGTHKEGLLTTQEELQRMRILCKIIHPMSGIDAMKSLINRLAMTETNDDFFEMMKCSQVCLMPKTPRVYVTFCFYICNLSTVLAMLGKSLEFAGVLRNLHVKQLVSAQCWQVRNGLSFLNKDLRGYTSANSFL